MKLRKVLGSVACAVVVALGMAVAPVAAYAADLVPISDEVDLNATGYSGGSWGQAVTIGTIKNDGGALDPALLVPDCIVTVTYESENAPELVLQSWTDGNVVAWAKVAPFASDGTVAQFNYNDMVAAFGTDDIVGLLDNFIVGDTGAELNVSKVTIGKESAEPELTAIETSDDEKAISQDEDELTAIEVSDDEKAIPQTGDSTGLVMSMALAGLGLSVVALISTRKISKASR